LTAIPVLKVNPQGAPDPSNEGYLIGNPP
jgi:hypothetical protein